MSPSKRPELSRLPSQTETVVWARMLAAARGADVIHTGGIVKKTTDSRTMKRLGTLFPVANDLYETMACKDAITLSEHIDDIIVHCQEFIETMESLYKELGISYKERFEEEWDETKCKKMAKQLPVPFMLKSLRPAPPNVIGLSMVPHSPVWRMVRTAILGNFTWVDKSLHDAYDQGMRNAKRVHNIDERALQRLQAVRFVDEVYARAPPFIGALPPQWTAANATDELLEAMQALLRMPGRRPLANLVKKLAEDEYDLLVDEHWCLSQILGAGNWPPRCAEDGRKVVDYVAFASFLLQDRNFKGLVVHVPRQRQTANRPNPKWLSTKRPSPIRKTSKPTYRKFTTRERRQVLSTDVESYAVTPRVTGESIALRHDGRGRQQLGDSHQVVASRGTDRSSTAAGLSEVPLSVISRRLPEGARQIAASKTSTSYSWLQDPAHPIQRATADSEADSHVNSKMLHVPGAAPVVTHSVFNSERTAQDGESPAPNDWEPINVNELPDLDERLDPDLGANGDVEMIDDRGHDPTVLAGIDPHEWLQAIPQSPIGRGPIVGLPLSGESWLDLRVLEQPRGAASDPDALLAQGTGANLKAERRELLLARGDGARVVSLAAAGATALGLVLVFAALVYRMRARLVFSRSRRQ